MREAIKLMQRDYDNPVSPTGPNPASILGPVTITSDGRQRPMQ
jgi:hypothetical protein